jgi:integrase
LLRVHVTPRFGKKRLTEITRQEIKAFLAELSRVTRVVDKVAVPRFSKNTLRLIMCALRTVMNAAVEDGFIESNPAAKIGKFAKSEKPAREACAMTRDEAEKFLTAVKEICTDWFPFFLTALRAGLRKGELIALKWGIFSSARVRKIPTATSWYTGIGHAVISRVRRVRNREGWTCRSSFVRRC